MLNHREASQEDDQMTIGERHHATWTELMVRWTLWFCELLLRQPTLQGLKAMTCAQSSSQGRSSSGSSGRASSWRCNAKMVVRCS